jgi:hypothetical protein
MPLCFAPQSGLLSKPECKKKVREPEKFIDCSLLSKDEGIP